jgi:hypothetical protein
MVTDADSEVNGGLASGKRAETTPGSEDRITITKPANLLVRRNRRVETPALAPLR